MHGIHTVRGLGKDRKVERGRGGRFGKKFQITRTTRYQKKKKAVKITKDCKIEGGNSRYKTGKCAATAAKKRNRK